MDESQENDRKDFKEDNPYGPNASPYQGGPYPQKQAQDANAVSVVGLVFGILSILTCCCTYYGLFLAIPGLICSIIGWRQTRSGVAMGGIICSIIGTVLCVIMTVLAVFLLNFVVSELGDPTLLSDPQALERAIYEYLNRMYY